MICVLVSIDENLFETDYVVNTTMAKRKGAGYVWITGIWFMIDLFQDHRAFLDFIRVIRRHLIPLNWGRDALFNYSCAACSLTKLSAIPVNASSVAFSLSRVP